MKTIRFAMFLFYRYYKGGRWESTPYFHALCSCALLIFLNFITVLFFFDAGDVLFTGKKIHLMFRFGIVFSVVIFLLSQVATKRTLNQFEIDAQSIKRGNWMLILYLIASFVVVFISMSSHTPEATKIDVRQYN